MRLRLGFVTNSSSTNHIIAWDGSKEDLRAVLEAHRDLFPTEFACYDDEFRIDADQAITAIVSLSDRIVPAKQMARGYLTESEHYASEAKTEDLPSIRQIWREHASGYKEIGNRLQERDWAIEVGFGDNEGDFSGGGLGYVMDYEGRHIEVEDADLTYTTVQNR